MRIRRLLFPTLIVAALAAIPATGAAADCDTWVAKIVSLQGVVEVRGSGQTEWRRAQRNDKYCAGDMLRAQARSRAAVVLANETIIRVDQQTTLTFSAPEDRETSWLEMLTGIVHFISRVPRSLKVKTPYVNAAIEGTEFVVSVEPGQASVAVFEGRVLASNAAGNTMLASGQSATARAGQPPVLHTVLRPRDAVQWALYYPAIMDYRAESFAAATRDAWRTQVGRSIAAYRAGDAAAALAEVAETPDGVTDPGFFTYRASLLLGVGRADEASADIGRALALDPRHGQARALQAIIALAQNDKARALERAHAAVKAAPESAAAHAALSYVEQAHFRLDAAIASARRAVELDPESALAWARLSELELSVGELDRAFDAAHEAMRRNPQVARTQTVLGYAYLTQIKTSDARGAFEKAITLDQADPLPRLGLGLVKIRKGELAAGRREIEIAASLDPNNALVRSYLGKAYYEERRGKVAAEQFAMAKELDPNDPTPWFYDAIRKQTENRPVEALHDVQKSIELNDNRAVYRSQLLLDADQAARSASLARIYSDLGFQQLALAEGWRAVNADPSDYSAHRFLSDSYANLPRHEIARVSELLQSQLLQPINVNPIQPQLAESSLGILDGAGPAQLAFNEFNPLFIRERVALQVDGVAGGDDTVGYDVVLAGLHDRFSYSIGQFRFETEGFRPNSDQDRSIANAFFQAQLSPRTSLQAEVRRTDAENGDLVLRFDPTNFDDTLREREETDSVRLGVRHGLAPNADILVSAVHQHRTGTQRLVFLPFGAFGSQFGEDGDMAEVQYLRRGPAVGLVLGAGTAQFDIDETTLAFGLPSGPFESKRRQTNAYAYAHIAAARTVTVSLGVSGDTVEGPVFGGIDLDHDRLNPKLGVTWQATPATTVRAAVFRTTNRTVVGDQTIEPTQVAGFNQFYDDAFATDAWRYGAAVDQRFAPGLYGGLELSGRRLEVPFVFTSFFPVPFSELREANWNEDGGRAYLNWAPHARVAVSAELFVERFKRGEQFDDYFGSDLFSALRTIRLPLRVRYFDPSGIVGGAGVSFVKQEGTFIDQFSPAFFVPGDDSFSVVDAMLGYRLPKRRGLLAIEVKNLFDKEFNYQETNPAVPLYYPARLVLARFLLSF